MNNKVNSQHGYAIEFLGAKEEPLAHCYVELSINGYSISESPLRADEQGRLVFHPSLVEQNARIQVVFWNEQYPKTEHSKVPEFTWMNGKTVVRLRAYNSYEITPRAIPNENNEQATYRRPYHVVKQGDTWEIIEKEAGINRYALQWENGLDDAVPLNTLVGQKIYFPKGTRKQKTTTKPTPTKTTPSSGSKQSESKASTNNKSIDNKKKSIPVAEKKAEEKPKAKPLIEDKKEQVVQERSENNGKSVDTVDKACPDECKVAEVVVFKTSKGNYIISKELWDYILSVETYVATPYVPSNGDDGKSGVTLGYGYDLGQQKKHTMYDELSEFYSSNQLKRLESALGVKGKKAYELSLTLSDITISKENAKKLAVIVKKRYAEMVVSIYPEILKYHPHCQGALLSLVYNRGTSLSSKDGSRKEMKDIQDVLKDDKANEIPSLLRSMKRLWTTRKNLGVAIRREKEAEWFEKGVKCDCF